MSTSSPEPVTGNEQFVEVYALATGLKQVVPRHFLDDPVLGAGIRRTPSQREVDGDLGPRPTQDSTVKEIDRFAKTAGIDLPAGAKHDEKLAAVEAVFASSGAQAGMEPVDPTPVPMDPLAPQFAAQGDPGDVPGVAVADPELADDPDSTHEQGGNPSPDETPAAGDEE